MTTRTRQPADHPPARRDTWSDVLGLAQQRTAEPPPVELARRIDDEQQARATGPAVVAVDLVVAAVARAVRLGAGVAIERRVWAHAGRHAR